MNIKWLIGAISVGLFISCENVKEAQTVSSSYRLFFLIIRLRLYLII